MRRSDWDDIARAVALVLFIAAILFLSSCALWQLGTPPGRDVRLPVCAGRYVHPDSAGHCTPRDTTEAR